MGQPNPPRIRRPLEVEEIFEPNRISAQCLIAAYEQILATIQLDLPARQRAAPKRKEAKPETEKQTTMNVIERRGGQSK